MVADSDLVTDWEERLDLPLSDFCQKLFSSLPRSDQRRWGETYVRGLLSVPSRKSIRRISEYVVGRRVDQCLQQFVNQSPWEWGPVRASLARHLTAAIRPSAWVIHEVVFPKNGSNSVAVDKQYAHSVGRTLNCQLGLAALLVTEEGSCPVNWRLMLPRCWSDDPYRRSRSYVPDTERCRSRWHYLLEAVDEMSGQWDLPLAPVIVDGRAEPAVELLLRALEARGLHYLVQVSAETKAVETPSDCPISAGELALAAAKQARTVVSWVDGARQRQIRAYVVLSATHAVYSTRIEPGYLHRRMRRVLGEWRAGRSWPHELWLTNLTVDNPAALHSLARLLGRTRDDLGRIGEESGLQHFEGRSFRGWHHHVTLASAAHAYRFLSPLPEMRSAPGA
ncbi:MAG: IS701 family transposase [Pseudonocardiaceae bacterium]